MRRLLSTATLAALLSCQAAQAGEWPQWRGPSLNGVSEEKNLPVKWSAAENVAWKLAMPDRSGSTPIVWGGRGDVSKSHLVWSTQNGPDVPTPVTDGKYFYVVNDRGIVWCLDAKTGREVYGQQRLKPGAYSASPVLADGRLYVTSEDGLTSVVKAGPQFEVLAENDLAEYCLSSPAVSEGQLFIRTAGHLYCIGQRRS